MQKDFSVLSDCELCKNADFPEAFKELESRYLWLIRVKAVELMKQSLYDIDDVIQEGFLGLYDAMRSFDENQNVLFKTYAGVCIQNRIKSELKRRNNKSNSLLTHSVPLDEIQFSVPSPEEDLERREDFNAVLNRIHISLSDFELKILALYLSGYQRSQIPTRCGISVKAFDNAMQRVRKKLKVHKVN
ncbi:MAG: sigma-70 family RNA polymerase sigma factor [Clostridia bacterium]